MLFGEEFIQCLQGGIVPDSPIGKTLGKTQAAFGILALPAFDEQPGVAQIAQRPLVCESGNGMIDYLFRVSFPGQLLNEVKRGMFASGEVRKTLGVAPLFLTFPKELGGKLFINFLIHPQVVGA